MEHRVELRFHRASRETGTRTDLSAGRPDGLGLRVAGDETATVEHPALRDGRYDDQRAFAPAGVVKMT
ncbi:hypothetical protein AB0J63_43415 [Streptosporangium canum]|uniref:hypothetical protein n=1 Tax=Streptosporangium canum TaxID=324952 RepID=UPI0034314E68